MTWRFRAGVGIATVVGVLVCAGTALANEDPRERQERRTRGQAIGNTLEAGASVARINYDTSEGGTGTGFTQSTSTWSPPACYYAPTHTPEEYRAYWAELSSSFYGAGHLPEDKEALRQSLEDLYGPDGEHPDFNIDRQGEGMFWQVVRNENHPDRDARWECEFRTFWVDFGDAPPAGIPQVVDIAMLAELAYERVRVPDTAVELNPAGAQTVNLPMWVWLPEGRFEPVSVTASLEGYGMSATTTATPVGLVVEPGTGDAVSHPGSGRCPVDAPAYHAGLVGQEPSCGVTYLRSTGEGDTYSLSASLRWEITWEGSDGSGGTLPDGVFETAYDLDVDEVQTVVR
ncbi:hypothetical protein [Streptomyces profundus]|uniref:hypothetical protein n=1 Tax=Streptomyces profundus TaxID=2867410 RepID=UPI001D16A01D|nr:hypothetical protein [Streptomyces sp. MA3_2.13]UED86114.1 hypothetical protein K4G22_19565 [Streptomyces sp. MA3_2.13]